MSYQIFYTSYTTICLLLALRTTLSQTLSSYCNLTCGPVHTACFRKQMNCKPAPECGPEPLDELDSDKHNILRKINSVRNSVAKGTFAQGIKTTVANMRLLSYSMELEYIAQCWANTCYFQKDQCRITEQFPTVGQIIMLTTNFITTLEQSLLTWMKPFEKSLDYKDEYQPDLETDFGNVLELIWAENTHVGCGATKYWDNIFVVCNFAPGKALYEQAFIEGPPCSKCPEGTKCNKKFTGLCGKRPMVEKFYMPLTSHSEKAHFESFLLVLYIFIKEF